MSSFWAWCGAFVAQLLMRWEELYLAYQLGQKQANLADAQHQLEDVEKAVEIKNRLDGMDAGSRERLRQWYAHWQGRELPGAAGIDADQ